jgi:hypothetical protein
MSSFGWRSVLALGVIWFFWRLQGPDYVMTNWLGPQVREWWTGRYYETWPLDHYSSQGIEGPGWEAHED